MSYIDLNEPTPLEKLEIHAEHFPKDIFVANLINAIRRIESLEDEVRSHASVVDRHRIIG